MSLDNMQMMPLVSVIVPIYNVEQFLDECMNSIINQTYRNLEIIMVDDGSPDSCPQMCDAWAGKDDRIRVIHKKNGGLASARNAALDVFTGDYVTYIDSDDWIDTDTIALMMQTIREQHVDVVMCSTSREYDAGFEGEPEGELPFRRLTSDEAVNDFLYQRDNLSGGAWGKIYAAKFFRGEDALRFPTGVNSEDYPVLARVYHAMDAMVMIPNRCYHYRIRSGSICTATEIGPHTFDKIVVQDTICDYLESIGYDNQYALAYYRMQGRYDVLYDLLRIGASRDVINKYRKQLADSAKLVYADNEVSFIKKLKLKAMCTVPQLYYRVK